MTAWISEENPCNTLGFSSLLINDGLHKVWELWNARPHQSLLAASGKVEAEGTTSLERHLSAPGNTPMTGVAKGNL